MFHTVWINAVRIRPAADFVGRPVPGILRKIVGGLGLAAACLAAACASLPGQGAPEAPCPAVVVIDDTAKVTKFRSGPGRDITDIVMEVRIVDVVGGCGTERHRDGPDTLDSEVNVTFGIGRGLAGNVRQAQFDYFVAVIDREENILVKEIFPVIVEFPAGRNSFSIVEQSFPSLNLGPGETGAEYGIVAGLQLTPEELRYNRGR